MLLDSKIIDFQLSQINTLSKNTPSNPYLNQNLQPQFSDQLYLFFFVIQITQSMCITRHSQVLQRIPVPKIFTKPTEKYLKRQSCQKQASISGVRQNNRSTSLSVQFNTFNQLNVSDLLKHNYCTKNLITKSLNDSRT